MFYVLFALERVANITVTFKIDEVVDFETLGVTFDGAGLVLIDPANEVVGNADVDSATRTADKNIDEVLSHRPSLPKRDGRDKPGHDNDDNPIAAAPNHPFFTLR